MAVLENINICFVETSWLVFWFKLVLRDILFHEFSPDYCYGASFTGYPKAIHQSSGKINLGLQLETLKGKWRILVLR
ncbi:MAG: hypothetical protein A3K09_06090 [Nitrospinae bacterium RIFCSPLOWO2_12_FULL_47_7]|nr:MAG: hypothetical protein A3K09_06090 [Nitrospinae bacterium RIFCSPLOWO2_12_FULL_47_7]